MSRSSRSRDTFSPASGPWARLIMDDRLLTRQQVEEYCGLSRSTIYRMMREQPPAFPTPIKISRRSVRWKESEILEWLATRPRATGDLVRDVEVHSWRL